MEVRAFQIYYEDSQAENLLPGFIPYFNTHTNIFLESSVISRIEKENRHLNYNWLGVFSHKVKEKLIHDPLYGDFSFKRIEYMCDHRASRIYDILAPKLSRYPWVNTRQRHNPREQHEGDSLWRCLDLLLNKLKIPNLNNGNYLDRQLDIIYTNSFMIRKQLMRDFIDSMLDPAIKLMETDEQLYELSRTKAQYTYPVPQNFTKFTGMTYWPIAPFILERMINVYILTHNKKVLFAL
jgi:hypothetical protein